MQKTTELGYKLRFMSGMHILYNLPPGSNRGGYVHSSQPAEVLITVFYFGREKTFDIRDEIFAMVGKYSKRKIKKISKRLAKAIEESKPAKIRLDVAGNKTSINKECLDEWALTAAVLLH